MAINWHKYLKRHVLTLALALAIIAPTANATLLTPAPTPTWIKLPPEVQPEVNWNS